MLIPSSLLLADLADSFMLSKSSLELADYSKRRYLPKVFEVIQSSDGASLQEKTIS